MSVPARITVVPCGTEAPPVPWARTDTLAVIQKSSIQRICFIIAPSRNRTLRYSEMKASASISTSISGVTSALTATSVAAGRMS